MGDARICQLLGHKHGHLLRNCSHTLYLGPRQVLFPAGGSGVVDMYVHGCGCRRKKCSSYLGPEVLYR